MNRPPALLFDLDGTLVDSSRGVLSSLSAALERSGCTPCQALTPKLIGPPLLETLQLLCPNLEAKVLEQLTTDFKDHYDSTGFQQTNQFAGVEKMLQSLAYAKIPLHIATNKRKLPTSRIVKLMGWSALFDLVISPDSVSPVLQSKTAILSTLLVEANLDAKDCLYIGDRYDDYKAAEEIGISFALAEWGFEGDVSSFPPDIIRMKNPDACQLISFAVDQDRSGRVQR